MLPLASLDGQSGFRMMELDRFEECGTSVAGLGDLNGDGLDDIVVGARRALGDRGRAYVVFGRDTLAGPAFPAAVSLAGLDGGDGFRLLGGERDRAGSAVASAGDINADGVGDIAIGAPANFGNGRTYVVFGRADGTYEAELELGSIGPGEGFRIGIDDDGGRAGSGAALASAGDINGDGFDDLAVGAPGWGFYDSGYHRYENYGAAFVVFGRDTARGGPFPDLLLLNELDGVDGVEFYGVRTGSWAGVAVAAAGDINADGSPDLAIGARRVDSFVGGAFVVYGRDLFPCPADIDGDGELTIFDFLAFQNLFDAGDPRADFDGDGELTIFDFLVFQTAFDAGC